MDNQKNLRTQVKFNQTDLDEISTRTLRHYNSNAASFWQGTRDHDVSQNIEAFLTKLPTGKSLDILDFGCGPGRDLLAFKKMGHQPVGLDGSQEFCSMAEKHANCKTLNQNFLNLELVPESFDGIFANASLFHVPSQKLPNVLTSLYRALRSKGVLFTSNPRGSAEGWQGSRYGHYMEIDVTKGYLEEAGFQVLSHYYRPKGMPIEQQPWLAVLSQKD